MGTREVTFDPNYDHSIPDMSDDPFVDGFTVALPEDEEEESDMVNLPDHYTKFNIEPIYFIMENGLDFETGNVIKYVCRAPYKNGVEDLEKARRYLDMMILKAKGVEDYAA